MASLGSVRLIGEAGYWLERRRRSPWGRGNDPRGGAIVLSSAAPPPRRKARGRPHGRPAIPLIFAAGSPWAGGVGSICSSQTIDGASPAPWE
jgi:hypothetical protein